MTAQEQASQQEQFRRAVLTSFDVTADPQLRSQASSSLDVLRQAEEGVRACQLNN